MVTKVQKQKSMLCDKVDINAIVLLVNSNCIPGIKKLFEYDFMGRPMWHYAKSAVKNYPTKTTIITPKTDVLEAVKPMLTKSKYTIILFSDAPLVTEKHIQREILCFVNSKEHIKVLQRGFIAETEYLKTLEKLPIFRFDLELSDSEFITVDCIEALNFTNRVKRQMIIENLQLSGVKAAFDFTYVEDTVSVGEGTSLDPFVVLKGETKIGKNCKILGHTTIINSTIGDNCTIKSAYIENAVIEDGKTVEAFERITGK